MKTTILASSTSVCTTTIADTRSYPAGRASARESTTSEFRATEVKTSTRAGPTSSQTACGEVAEQWHDDEERDVDGDGRRDLPDRIPLEATDDP